MKRVIKNLQYLDKKMEENCTSWKKKPWKWKAIINIHWVFLHLKFINNVESEKEKVFKKLYNSRRNSKWNRDLLYVKKTWKQKHQKSCHLRAFKYFSSIFSILFKKTTQETKKRDEKWWKNTLKSSRRRLSINVNKKILKKIKCFFNNIILCHL